MDPASFERAIGLIFPPSGLLWAPVEAAAVPQPFRTLLVHKTDMTSTLENFYKEKLHVEVLGRHTTGQEYYREVVLRLDQSGRRVEFGAIKILLDLFPHDARQEILREHQPLGRILIESGVEFSSQPRGFVRLIPDDFISRTLALSGPQVLYGRRNTLVDPWDRPLAEIVEILPPA
jgi:chorismate-pyruvate lyase